MWTPVVGPVPAVWCGVDRAGVPSMEHARRRWIERCAAGGMHSDFRLSTELSSGVGGSVTARVRRDHVLRPPGCHTSERECDAGRMADLVSMCFPVRRNHGIASTGGALHSEFRARPGLGVHSRVLDAECGNHGSFTAFCIQHAPCGAGSGAGALLDPGGELLDLVVGAAAFGHLLADLSVRVHHGGVVTTT